MKISAMKTFILSLVWVAVLSAASFSQSLTVHEWGTFTTLHGSDGGTLSGLYIEEEALPPFVYHHPGFSPDPIITTNGYRPVKNCTVKMETPVLYFYTDKETKVKVHVDFPSGTISQWYPNRSGGELSPTSDTLTVGGEQNGFIDWDATVLASGSKEELTQKVISRKWYDPRQTESNLIKNNDGDVEKYLFYRGLANFGLPLALHFLNDNTLEVKNNSALSIPFLYIYDHTNNSTVQMWGVGPLAAGETRVFHRPDTVYYDDINAPERQKFLTALQTAGLAPREALAMLNTWADGYFQTVGFKVFWIVPRELTDQILPLQIAPKPDLLERVLVAKTEILTPTFEKELLHYYSSQNMAHYDNDKYHIAYSQRAKQLAPFASVKSYSSDNTFFISPNPASSHIHITSNAPNNSSDRVEITMRNVLGVSVLHTTTHESLVNGYDLDIRSLLLGYMLSVLPTVIKRQCSS